MSQTAILDQIIDVVSEIFAVDRGTLGAESAAIDVDGWDSVSHTMLILALEERLGVELPFGDTLKLSNLGALANFIEKRSQ